MYSATFIFDKKQFDETFYQLDQAIAEIAKQTIGYLGEEAWENPETGRVSNVYYWQTMEGLHELMKHPKHLEAKATQSNWLNGYQVVISQVLRTYGDGVISHPTASFTNEPIIQAGRLTAPLISYVRPLLIVSSMKEHHSKWVLVFEALLLATPCTFLFILWCADQVAWHSKEYLLNLTTLFIASGLFAGWWLMISFWRGGASRLQKVHSAIWASAVINGIISLLVVVLLTTANAVEIKNFSIFAFGLPLLVPMIHLILEQRRHVPNI